MSHDEFNSGARHGFSMALLAVRSIDKQIEYPDDYEKDQSVFIRYNAQKDLLYKIYSEIKKERELEVHDDDY
jgi:hypothetical protein